MATESIFTMDTSSIKFGIGATSEIGFEMARLGATRVMVVTDPNLRDSDAGCPWHCFLEGRRAGRSPVRQRRRVEPTDASFHEAIAFATDGGFDGYVGIGGGSAIDTAKAANLYATYPADLLAYVNAPIGRRSRCLARSSR